MNIIGAAVGTVVTVVTAVLVGWALPALAAKGILPALERSTHRVTNYRGRRIPTGLGLVWAVWAAGVALAGSLLWLVGWFFERLDLSPVAAVLYAAAEPFSFIPVPLVIGAVLFGLADDLFGDASAKGFRGHLAALVHGRLTTGGLKVLGIGVLAAAAAVQVAFAADKSGGSGLLVLITGVWTWVLATVAIALAANFINLTDLRPGRALKTYGVLASLGVVLVATAQWWGSGGFELLGDIPLFLRSTLDVGTTKVALLVLVLGPALAVWTSDLRERAILGDAGANAMGALAGYLLVARSPLWLTVIIVVVLLALNIASERVSFSSVIERVGFLRWFDGLGRTSPGPGDTAVQVGDDGERAGGPGSEGYDA